MVICLELGADSHIAQLMPLPVTVSCFSKIQIGFYRAMLSIRGTSHGPVSVRHKSVFCRNGQTNQAGFCRELPSSRPTLC